MDSGAVQVQCANTKYLRTWLPRRTAGASSGFSGLRRRNDIVGMLPCSVWGGWGLLSDSIVTHQLHNCRLLQVLLLRSFASR